MKEFCLLQEEEYARFQETSELRGFLIPEKQSN